VGDPELLKLAQQWCNDIMVWIGFGTIVGLLAKAIMPGRDPGGTVATLFMGIGGTAIGCGLVSYFAGQRITPISPVGLAVATAGAFVILLFYRLLGGYLFSEDGTYRGRSLRDPYRRAPLRSPHRRRRVDSLQYDD
jgi:uncharacterized membrane protein YeaQ/YmgE (transglycosylase-associated protein family)